MSLEAAGVSGFALVAAMWSAMTLAMMLPSAGPMILTYAEIAETAARKGERIVSPLAIAFGYTVVWLGFALVAATIQFLVAPLAATSANKLFAGALFALAGLYQFTALKHACLSKCQQPFPFFFAHWQTKARGVFRLGLMQGVYCLGCCWALMLLMFATGTMNVLWMAVLGVVMTVEKMTKSAVFSRATGIVLLAIAAAIVLTNPGVLR
jgi:predicted metal-binding membrane protein